MTEKGRRYRPFLLPFWRCFLTLRTGLGMKNGQRPIRPWRMLRRCLVAQAALRHSEKSAPADRQPSKALG